MIRFSLREEGEPLVDAVHTDGKPAMDRRHVRGSRRRKLAGQLRHVAVLPCVFEKRMFGVPFIPLPAEGVEVHEQHMLVPPRQRSQIERMTQTSSPSGPARPSPATCQNRRCHEPGDTRPRYPRAEAAQPVTLTARVSHAAFPVGSIASAASVWHLTHQEDWAFAFSAFHPHNGPAPGNRAASDRQCLGAGESRGRAVARRAPGARPTPRVTRRSDYPRRRAAAPAEPLRAACPLPVVSADCR